MCQEEEYGLKLIFSLYGTNSVRVRLLQFSSGEKNEDAQRVATCQKRNGKKEPFSSCTSMCKNANTVFGCTELCSVIFVTMLFAFNLCSICLGRSLCSAFFV